MSKRKSSSSDITDSKPAPAAAPAADAPAPSPSKFPLELDGSIDKTVPYCLGIDEAGRGPVLGPMVYGCAYYPVSGKEQFARLGFADSKTLTEDKRESLFAKIISLNIGFKTIPLQADFLSTSMLRIQKYNLNDISHDTAIQLIRDTLKKGVKIAEIYVDTVGPPAKYQRKLERLFPGIAITVSKKADSLFPIVSAASICAKVIRDHLLRTWKFKEDIEISRAFGSGYPSDPTTRKWLKNNWDPVFGYPTVIRFSWKTTDNFLSDAVDVDWVGEDDEESTWQPQQKKAKKQQPIKPPPKPATRYRFFADRQLDIVTDFE